MIAIIRGSANRAEARENLVAYFGGKKIEINVTGHAIRAFGRSNARSRSPRVRPTPSSNCNCTA